MRHSRTYEIGKGGRTAPSLGMAQEAILSGPLADLSGRIVETRQSLRTRHGWIMDIYLLRRG